MSQSISKGCRVLLLGFVALLIFLTLPSLLRVIDPTSGGFPPDTINAYALGAFQYFAALTMAYAGWRWLFPSLYAYAAETIEGKLLESITSDLISRLEDACRHAFKPAEISSAHADFLIAASRLDMSAAAERRKIATLQFAIRCARFVFSVSPFVFFFVQANHALASALTAVPSGGPGL